MTTSRVMDKGYELSSRSWGATAGSVQQGDFVFFPDGTLCVPF